MASDFDEALPETCPNCARPRSEWTANDGLGVISGGVSYCSSDCALRDAAVQTAD